MEQTAELRKSGIGGSDVAAIAGLSKYKSPVDVYLEKLGEAPPQEQSEAAYFGNILEPIVAEEYVRRTGRKVRRVNKTIRHADLPIMMAHVDRMVIGTERILECKISGRFFKWDEWGEAGTDQVPESYLLQVQHYLEVTGRDIADLAVLLAGTDYRIYTIPRDKEIGKMLLELCRDFWKRVETRNPPAIRSVDDAISLWPHDKGTSKVATPEIAELVQEFRTKKALEKEIKERLDVLKVELADFLQEDSYLISSTGDKLLSWKEKSSARVDATRLKDEAFEIYEKFLKKSSTREFR